MKRFLPLIFLVPLLLTGCANSGGGWISANNPDYHSKPGPDGEAIIKEEIAMREDSDKRVV